MACELVHFVHVGDQKNDSTNWN